MLTVKGGAMAFHSNPSFLGDGLVYDSNDWDTVTQQGNEGTKNRLACSQKYAPSGQAVGALFSSVCLYTHHACLSCDRFYSFQNTKDTDAGAGAGAFGHAGLAHCLKSYAHL